MGSVDNKDNTGIKGISDMRIGAAGAADESIELLINGFRLLQREPYAKLGMDSVLLSAFLHPSKALKICDMGCGAGALSILLAARYHAAHIVGIDIQKGAVELLEENISINGVGDRVSAMHADLREIEDKLPAGAYTAVVCNPPYFRQGAGKPGSLAEKRVERTEEGARIGEICRTASFLLQNGGEFAAVYRTERLCDLLAAMRGAGIEPKRLRFVHGIVSAEPKLLLIAGRKNSRPGIKVLPPFIIKKEDGGFTEEYLSLYQNPGRSMGYV
jgi:tRNA1Val (adenine37-N6)-methyltransferase